MKLHSLMAFFVVGVLGLFVLLALSLYRNAVLLDEEAGQLAAAGESIRLAEELKARLLTHNRNALLFAINGDPRRRESRRAQGIEINHLLNRLRVLANDDGELAMVDEVATEIQVYRNERALIDSVGLAPLEAYNRVSGLVDDALREIDRLVLLNSVQMSELNARVNVQNRLAPRLALALGLAGTLILLLLMLLVHRLVTRPLTELSGRIREYGQSGRPLPAVEQGSHEIREIAARFNDMTARLEQRRQEQLRFIASIAHDLRNPLQALSLAVQSLQLPGRKPADIQGMLSRQVQHLDTLLGDLLETSRIEAGQLRLDCRETELNGVVRDCVEMHRGLSEAHELVLDLPEQSVSCECDPSRVTQVLNNLLSNAIKYSPAGGRVSVRLRGEDEGCRISVRDQGIGIAEEEHERIFQPFQRSKSVREAIPGIGLGLSASRRIAQAHHGRLEFVSRHGEGSTFVLTLPRRQPRSDTD